MLLTANLLQKGMECKKQLYEGQMQKGAEARAADSARHRQQHEQLQASRDALQKQLATTEAEFRLALQVSPHTPAMLQSVCNSVLGITQNLTKTYRTLLLIHVHMLQKNFCPCIFPMMSKFCRAAFSSTLQPVLPTRPDQAMSLQEHDKAISQHQQEQQHLASSLSDCQGAIQRAHQQHQVLQ